MPLLDTSTRPRQLLTSVRNKEQMPSSCAKNTHTSLVDDDMVVHHPACRSLTRNSTGCFYALTGVSPRIAYSMSPMQCMCHEISSFTYRTGSTLLNPTAAGTLQRILVNLFLQPQVEPICHPGPFLPPQLFSLVSGNNFRMSTKVNSHKKSQPRPETMGVA